MGDTFSWPNPTLEQRERVAEKAQAVLDARAPHADAAHEPPHPGHDADGRPACPVNKTVDRWCMLPI